MKVYITAKEARENTNNAIKRLEDDAILDIFERIRQESIKGNNFLVYYISSKLNKNKEWIEKVRDLLESKGYIVYYFESNSSIKINW